MGLADEIMGQIAEHVTAWLGDAGGRVWIPDVTRTREVLKARLTAIEQELEGYRQDRERGGRIEGGACEAVAQRDSLAGVLYGVRTVQPSDLDASHPPFLNAQTGYDSEDGG